MGGSRLCDSGAMAAGQPYGQVRLWVEGKVCATLHGAAPFPVLCWSCGSGVRELWVPLLWGYPIGKEGCFLTSKVGGIPKGTLGLEHPPVLLLGASSWFGALFCNFFAVLLLGDCMASLLSWGGSILQGC